MEVVEATGRVLEAGKSPELTALLASVAEATSADGEPRYGAKTYLALTQAVVCRTYAKPVLQLCHLINAADACGAGPDRWERFFYGVDAARSSAFKGNLARTLEQSGWRRPGFEATSEGVSIQYEDGLFNVRYGRMPLLAALLETALTMIGYREVNDIFADMFARGGDRSAVNDAANHLSRSIYAYLKEHLPSNQSADKFEAILNFLKSGRETGAVDVDDDTVLQFWCAQDQANSDNEGDFRTFKTAVGAFIDFLRALDTGGSRNAVSRASTIGGDAQSGEVDPGDVDDNDWLQGDWINPLAALDEPPVDGIKFLNKKEREDVDILMNYGPLIANLPLTVLRSDTFGAQQARITQAIRRRPDPKKLAALISCVEVEPYADCAKRYQKADQHLDRVQKAALHALLTEAGGELDDVEDPGLGEDLGDNVVPLFANSAAPAGATSEILEQAASVFKNISRQGFDEADLADPDIRDGFRVGAEALVQIRDHLDRYLSTLDRLQKVDPDFAEQFKTDLKTFRNRFSVLYGGPS